MHHDNGSLIVKSKISWYKLLNGDNKGVKIDTNYNLKIILENKKLILPEDVVVKSGDKLINKKIIVIGIIIWTPIYFNIATILNDFLK